MDRRVVGNIMEEAGENDVVVIFIENSIREQEISKLRSCLQKVVGKRKGRENKIQE